MNKQNTKFNDSLKRYLKDVKNCNSESAKSQRFTAFLQETISVIPEFIGSYCKGIEKSIKHESSTRIIKGQVDNLFGNLIIEFKKNVDKYLDDAKYEIKKYTSILWSNEDKDHRVNYLGIVTDGINFIVYSVDLNDSEKIDISPEDIKLNIVDKIDWSSMNGDNIFYWLDRYFLRKEIYEPTSSLIVEEFGLNSHAFHVFFSTLYSIWLKIKNENMFSVIYETWEKYLTIAYGKTNIKDELFIKHTYLSTLAKLMSWLKLENNPELSENDILKVINGEFFKSLGLENFIDEDLFTWLSRYPDQNVISRLLKMLYSLLKDFNLSSLNQDVFKALYQELVSPEIRHDLGEVYTPDWLAESIVEDVFEENPENSIFDPACGSGTFLYFSIKKKIQKLSDDSSTLQHILNSVVGADVHPLAITIARTNYLLALGNLITKRKSSISIPVYFADTLRIPEIAKTNSKQPSQSNMLDKIPSYRVYLDNEEIPLKEPPINDVSKYDHIINLASEYARKNKKIHVLEGFSSYLNSQLKTKIDKSTLNWAYQIMRKLVKFVKKDRDTIWGFILRNIYKPIILRNRFDIVIGNPPWISLRFLEKNYQSFIKNQMKSYALIKGRSELVTQLDVCLLFFVKVVDLYLKNNGKIAFVMPRSVFSSDQYHELRKNDISLLNSPGYNINFKEMWDCLDVVPLFNVPSCVIFAKKEKEIENVSSLPLKIFSGKLKSKNESLSKAKDSLSIQKSEIYLNIGDTRSYFTTTNDTFRMKKSNYDKKFHQGATLVPRSLWFMEFKKTKLGMDLSKPSVETDKEIFKTASKPYLLKKNIEDRFIFATILPRDIVPFSFRKYKMIVLPLINENNGNFLLLTKEKAQEKGFELLTKWLVEAEKVWENLRSNEMNIYERLDYSKGISSQKNNSKCKVLYNSSGKDLYSTVINFEDVYFSCGEQRIKANGFIADSKTYIAEFETKEEANFITAFLNSPLINTIIKPLQSRGNQGPRDIHKKVFEFPIPLFNINNPDHQKLSKLSEVCSKKVQTIIFTSKNVKTPKLRRIIKEKLKDELSKIDEIVDSLLRS